MGGLTAAQLAELAAPYRGKEPGEQEYELAVALARAGGENQTPDLGVKDFWLRVRDDLAGKVVALRVTIEATAVTAADQVLRWAAGPRGVGSSLVYEIPLAILTAMVTDSVINAIGKDSERGKGPS
jgi:hypothetical protein